MQLHQRNASQFEVKYSRANNVTSCDVVSIFDTVLKNLLEQRSASDLQNACVKIYFNISIKNSSQK